MQLKGTGVEFRFGLRESKLILKFQLLHISMEKLILISGCYENHCENRFSDSRRISSPGNKQIQTKQKGNIILLKFDDTQYSNKKVKYAFLR